jgi:hypothetical protein
MRIEGLYDICSGRRVSMWLFVVILIIGFSIGQRFRADVFQIPQHRKALFVGGHCKTNRIVTTTKQNLEELTKKSLLNMNKISFKMKNILTYLLVFSITYARSQVSQNSTGNKNQTLQNNMKIDPLFPSKNYNECKGIILDKKKEAIFFATNGKYIPKYNQLNSAEPKLIATINEVKNTWNDDNGDTFVHEIKFGNDGFIYAAAENCILKINLKNGNYTTIIKDGFIGQWGAYGLDLDSNGYIYVGEHHGRIYVYLKNKNWSRKTIISSTDNSIKKSIGGILS